MSSLTKYNRHELPCEIYQARVTLRNVTGANTTNNITGASTTNNIIGLISSSWCTKTNNTVLVSEFYLKLSIEIHFSNIVSNIYPLNIYFISKININSKNAFKKIYQHFTLKYLKFNYKNKSYSIIKL